MINKISAIFIEQLLVQIEDMLTNEGVRRFTVFKVQGRGEFANMIDSHSMNAYYQMDIYIGESKTNHIVEKLLNELHNVGEDEGIITVIPVKNLFNTNTKKEIKDSNYNHLG
ncbi:hypothetical protein KP803_14550 [Vibrio sp. ZSDE26]|uniref:P-II family nitrogen regulator n=1 Tax=Vibrio amylolyticus TaxID=2847292 RepID=A0A9X1XMC7_9VIBR|nr:P-II family nitrogen regulator [Vibrio amylolyticus]MCK6264498.1 hypothetical protein [Vibrio amylolyticus]